MSSAGPAVQSRPHAKARKAVAYLAAGYLIAVVGLWISLFEWADVKPFPTLVIFGPRWLAALPLLALVPCALFLRSPVSIASIILASLVAAGPLSGLHFNIGSIARSERESQSSLRVVSWNMEGLQPGSEFKEFLQETQPMVLACQESALSADRLPEGWYLAGTGSNQVASRFPIRHEADMNFFALGVGGQIDRFVLDAPEGRITLVDAHLPTPRPGIEAAIGTKLRNLAELRNIGRIRSEASRSARAWVGEPTPKTLVFGDFNMPVESCIYRRDWSDFRNAYSDAGLGWGTTKQTSWFGVRIDHILYSSAWGCGRVWVGPAMGSDHRPMIAELFLKAEG